MRTLFLSLAIATLSTYMSGQNVDWVVNANFPEGYPFPLMPPTSEGRTISVDADGNSYVAGMYNDALFIDNQELFSNPLTQTMYILKLNEAGGILWGKEIKSSIPQSNQPGYARPAKLLIDNDGNIIVSGSFYGAVDFDPSEEIDEIFESNGGTRNFILKLSSGGEFIWVRQIHENAVGLGLNVQDISIDESNNINAVGRYDEVVYFEQTEMLLSPISPSSNGFNQYLMKLNSDGEFSWAKTITNSNVTLTKILLLPNENNQTKVLICANNFFGTIDTETYPYLEGVVAGLSSIRAITFSSAGISSGHITLLNNANDFTISHGNVDNAGNYFVYGKLAGSLDFDHGSNSFVLTNPIGNQSLVVLKCDSNGNFSWAKQFSSQAINVISALVDNTGGSVILGKINGTVDFDPNSGVVSHTYSGTSSEVFLLSLHPDGALRSVKYLGEHTQLFGQIITNNNEEIYYTGCYTGTIDFSSYGSGIVIQSFAPANIYSAIICKFNFGQCADLFPYIASTAELDCEGSSGLAEAGVLGGTAPYQFVWNTNPPTEGNIVSVDSTGIYTVSVTDSEGCQRSVGAYIHGPDIVDYYDFRTDIIVLNSQFVPGQNTTIRVIATNEGCMAHEGILKFVLDPFTNYSQSNIAPSNIIGDTLYFNTGLLQFEDIPFYVDIVINTNTTAVAGDIVCFSSDIIPIDNDYNLTNNDKTVCRFVQVSYDPNLKSVYPIGECEQHYVELNQKLTYTVQFQNTGTFAAINIAVMDTLSPYMDLNTLRVIHSSHDMITEVYDGHILKFKFPNIWLADSTSNEAESHGYIIFEIAPKSTIASGTMIENKVAIYFDYNEPVITNTVFNTFVNSIPECVVNVDEFVAQNESLLLYPNPSTDLLTVVFKASSNSNVQIRITDITSKIIEQTNHNASSPLMLDTSMLSSGVYVLSVISGNDLSTVRFVKQ